MRLSYCKCSLVNCFHLINSVLMGLICIDLWSSGVFFFTTIWDSFTGIAQFIFLLDVDWENVSILLWQMILQWWFLMIPAIHACIFVSVYLCVHVHLNIPEAYVPVNGCMYLYTYEVSDGLAKWFYSDCPSGCSLVFLLSSLYMFISSSDG